MITSLVPILTGGAVAAIVTDAAAGETRPPWVVIATALALVLASFALSLGASRTTARYVERARNRTRAIRVHVALGLFTWVLLHAAYGLVLVEGGLAARAHELGGTLEAAVLLGPWLIACFAAWTGSELGERAVFARTRSLGAELFARARMVLVPLSLALVLEGGVNLARNVEPLRELVDLNPRLRALGASGFVLVLFALSPWFLRAIFTSVPMPSFPAAVSPALARATERFQFRRWELGGPIATAAIAGLLPRHRVVFVTERLLEMLDPEEAAAVLRHELAHAELGHVRANALLAAGLVLVLDDLLRVLGLLGPDVGLAVGGALLALGFVLFVRLSKRLEHDADLFAMATAGDRPLPVMKALAKACAANGADPGQGGFRHPSVAARIELLGRALGDPGSAARRLGRSRWLLRGVTVAFGLALGWSLASLAREARRPVADRLVEAAERLAADDGDLARRYAERALADDPTDARPLELLDRLGR